jgi:hypothetical protein
MINFIPDYLVQLESNFLFFFKYPLWLTSLNGIHGNRV